MDEARRDTVRARERGPRDATATVPVARFDWPASSARPDWPVSNARVRASALGRAGPARAARRPPSAPAPSVRRLPSLYHPRPTIV